MELKAVTACVAQYHMVSMLGNWWRAGNFPNTRIFQKIDDGLQKIRNRTMLHAHVANKILDINKRPADRRTSALLGTLKLTLRRAHIPEFNDSFTVKEIATLYGEDDLRQKFQREELDRAMDAINADELFRAMEEDGEWIDNTPTYQQPAPATMEVDDPALHTVPQDAIDEYINNVMAQHTQSGTTVTNEEVDAFIDRIMQGSPEDDQVDGVQAGGSGNDAEIAKEPEPEELDITDFEKRFDWKSLFTLNKEGQTETKKFHHIKYRYSVQVAPLPQIFTPKLSVFAMPHIFQAILDLCTKDFRPNDRIIITLLSDSLDHPMYLSMRKFGQFNIDALMQKFTLLNSKHKFCIDESFGILIDRTIIPSGGKRRVHIHSSMDRKRFSTSIVQVHVDNNLCLPASLILGRYYHTEGTQGQQWGALTDRRRKILKRDAGKLVEEAGLRVGDRFSLDDIVTFQQTVLPEFQIKVISVPDRNLVIAKVPEKKERGMKVIYLLYENNHFDLVTKPTGFYCTSYYCQDCDKAYSRKCEHRCEGKCNLCYRFRDECMIEEEVDCEDCGRIFNNQVCFNIHKKKRKNDKSYCDQLFVCAECSTFVNMTRRPDDTHRCNEMHCMTCKKWVPQANHRCYMKPLEEKEYPAVPRHKNFDYETYVDEDGLHRPCYVVAQYPSGEEFRFPPDGTPMANYDVANEFGKWVFREDHRGYTLVAHNLRGYDGHFLLAYLLDNNLKGVEVTRRGTQLLDIRYRSLEICCRDTLNFVATKLSKFPKAVGLEDVQVKKGEFPHRFNKPENWDKVLPFPDLTLYSSEGLMKADREKLAKWHAEESLKKDHLFDFREEISSYCANDVTVLRRCALKFRQNFMDQTAIDPFTSMTIASACQTYYRTHVLEESEIGIISSNGYQANRKKSKQATQWLEWLKETIPTIQHGRDGVSREKRIGKYFVDGYDPATKTVYEYNGCVFHGHPICTCEDDRAPFSNRKMRELYEEWTRKKDYLEFRGYKVEVKWSCDWVRERTEPTIAAFLKSMELRDPLKPRDAFKGGRTNAAKLFHEVGPGEKIMHQDIVSLYPYVNKTCEYPVGHPRIIISNFQPVEEYFGFVYCKVLPPDNLYFPILPATVNGKLTFSLCAKCADTAQNDYCRHTDEERALEGVWCTTELHHALKKGYKMMDMYEVWHWDSRKKGLFAEYVNKFLKEKLEASGWPQDCITEEQKQKYLADIEKREGITLDPERIEDNPARRAVAKIMLNSFWGKFGQRDNFQETLFINSAKQYFDLLRSEAIEIHSVHAVNANTMMVTKSKKEDFIEGSNSVNIAIAAFTTSHARLKLLNRMEKLGERVLYYDTDSVIFTCKEDQWMPQTGTFLGDWSNELEHGETHITKFVSCGPKVYSYQTNTGRVELKAKGLTQNGYTEDIMDVDLVRTGEQLNFDKLKSILSGETIQVVYPEYFKRNMKTQEISTVKLAKRLQKVYDKRILRDDFTTIPFGSKRRLSHV
ncbi:uncharacterized protein LOC129592111 [Paramacrobiotus metropolitanus]|uniref:uncharacterized protein LOC129592111 n=1 Tax=Paramacrobiotus metropolitanus TaxID=2943436 RepID=UPI002445DD9F|nr:uncharacterized protein LOC129592111 [Paramacrobiotus metropolitanus]